MGLQALDLSNLSYLRFGHFKVFPLGKLCSVSLHFVPCSHSQIQASAITFCWNTCLKSSSLLLYLFRYFNPETLVLFSALQCYLSPSARHFKISKDGCVAFLSLDVQYSITFCSLFPPTSCSFRYQYLCSVPPSYSLFSSCLLQPCEYSWW